MKIHGFVHLICPLDQQPLLANSQGWECPQGHQFDRAKQGYVNLLPVQHKKSLNPGDNKDMVRARQRFLDSGHYSAVAVTLSQLVLAHITINPGVEAAYLDAGCGEGYYLQEFVKQAKMTSVSVSLLGLDISKWAIQAAAKRSKNVQWVVGTNASIPASTASFNVISAVFGFPVYTEFARVLKPAGLLIVVEPTARHLHELRDIIYPEISSVERPTNAAPAGFESNSVHRVCYQVELEGSESIISLLAMTPHVHRITSAALKKIEQLNKLSVTVDMQLTTYLRSGSTVLP